MLAWSTPSRACRRTSRAGCARHWRGWRSGWRPLISGRSPRPALRCLRSRRPRGCRANGPTHPHRVYAALTARGGVEHNPRRSGGALPRGARRVCRPACRTGRRRLPPRRPPVCRARRGVSAAWEGRPQPASRKPSALGRRASPRWEAGLPPRAEHPRAHCPPPGGAPLGTISPGRARSRPHRSQIVQRRPLRSRKTGSWQRMMRSDARPRRAPARLGAPLRRFRQTLHRRSQACPRIRKIRPSTRPWLHHSQPTSHAVLLLPARAATCRGPHPHRGAPPLRSRSGAVRRGQPLRHRLDRWAHGPRPRRKCLPVAQGRCEVWGTWKLPKEGRRPGACARQCMRCAP